MLNHLRPGVSPTELALASELGCNQGPGPDGLMRRQGDGLVLCGGHRGTTATLLDPAEAAETLALRRRIETRAAIAAAGAADGSAVERLGELRQPMDAAASAGGEYALIELDMAFHLEVFRLAGLRALEQILVRCMLHSHRQKLWEPRHRRRLAETAARHDVLLERLAARDGSGLAVALGDHSDTIVETGAERAVS